MKLDNFYHLEFSAFILIVIFTEEDRKTHQPKRCEYNNKEEDNSPNILNDKKNLIF